ncbi:thioesterase-like superfamily-domain-containing protein [Thamnocephalis sphaerospora]|uniref:Thioesterase-like superfamily-domain-containing protein n=1 Tax=Thamnocephalis sphaerospora TaxID=78915 RepID=A0A4P9XPL5_9FUNG|nr:thioesterase-like superfamily-domain-containing protein [Thamnocephalis sphaerospora]|eukprot:RKP07938.1 thioesterase-like superfamily-domain-containing protein [Thamnocephalis sphaerospora]
MSDSSDNAPQRALIEAFLELEEIEPNLYRSGTEHLWLPPRARGVFGGQVVGQALAAATKTVSASFVVHSLHTYFLLAGDQAVPIIYHVQRVRDGKSFATRTVKASQKGRCIFTCTCSFQVPEESHHEYQVPMPNAPDPESLRNHKDILVDWMQLKGMPPQLYEELQIRLDDPAPIDIRQTVEPTLKDWLSPKKQDPHKMIWMRATGKLNNDPHLHQCVLAYSTDHQLLWSGALPLGVNTFSRPERVNMIASLDHTVWFHAPVRADEWLLYVMDGDRVAGNRAFVRGRVYSQDGRLVASVAQEGLIRVGPAPSTSKSQESKL